MGKFRQKLGYFLFQHLATLTATRYGLIRGFFFLAFFLHFLHSCHWRLLPLRPQNDLTALPSFSNLIFLRHTYERKTLGGLSTSVTRFGEISPLWPHFKYLAFVYGYNLALDKFLNLPWQIANAIRQIFIVANGQNVTNNLAIWSHCSPLAIENDCTSPTKY